MIRRLLVLLLGAVTVLAAGGCLGGRDAASDARGPSGASTGASPTVPPPAVPVSGVTPLATAAATVPASNRPAPGGGASPVEPPTTPTAWDGNAVVADPERYYRIPCPAAADPARSNPGIVVNVDTAAQLACVVQSMRVGALPEAATAFLQRYGVFLTGYEEQGRVDTGSITAAWLNMGRPEPVFLNAIPAMLPLSQLVGAGAGSPVRQWIAHPAMQTALKGESDVVAWPEYAKLAASAVQGGGQRFVAELPLRRCRACPDLAALRVAFRFEASGAYAGWELLPPGPAATPGGTPGGR